MRGYQSAGKQSSGYEPIVDQDNNRTGTYRAMDIENSRLVKSSEGGDKWRTVSRLGLILFTFCIVGLSSVYFTMSRQSSTDHLMHVDVQKAAAAIAQFDQLGRFTMRHFDTSKPVADFLNGLGGIWGVPLWAFYVNRGQVITSFGRQNKDGAIEKFVTAEKAYEQTPYTGFRTFVKGRRGSKQFVHMPFFPFGLNSCKDSPSSESISRDLMIGRNEVEIEEVEPSLGLRTNVLYFTPPDEDYPSLIRSATFTNLDPTSELVIDVLDGLAKLIPNGFNNGVIDAMGRTMEAYMRVYNVGEESIKEPFFHASQSIADTAMVSQIVDGQFMVSFVEGSSLDSDGKYLPLDVIVDPSVVFDTDTSLTNPKGFVEASSLETLLKGSQGTTARTPCTYAGAVLTIPAGKSVTITSVYGYSTDLATFTDVISPKVRSPGYIQKKRADAFQLVADITKAVSTTTSSIIFNEYIEQDYLDNVLRGGLPLPLGDPSDPKIFHTFSRIHGDTERDYNNFQIDTTYYSQGPGNFRDVSQNRRLDVLLSPQVKDFNVRMFLSFVQADGYNPLTVASTLFKVPADALDGLVASLQVLGGRDDAVKASLSKPIRPGQFFMDMHNWKVSFGITKEEVLQKIIISSKQYFAAQFAQNAFWADHWTYTLDLVNNYLSVYPEKEESLLWEAEPVPFYLSPAYVLSRKDRYSLVDNPKHPGTSTIRVYNPIVIAGQPGFSKELSDELAAIANSPDYVADIYGPAAQWVRDATGQTVTVSIGAKLLMLGVIKFSTLDPYGAGVEYEGGKPGWNDAMNGLPGILGSGMPETYEMLQILKFMHSAQSKFGKPIEVPQEFFTFLTSLDAALKEFALSQKDAAADWIYWDASNNAREAYRAETLVRFIGTKASVSADYLVPLLAAMISKVNAGISKAVASNGGFSPTYFSYECTEYVILPVTSVTIPAQPDKVVCKRFAQNPLPLFLEGPIRHMKTIENIDERRDIYTRAKNSNMYDKPLKMFTLSESLASMGSDVGRMVAFSPGWLENQSVWLHMSYKFYLELLRGGLYDEFFTEIATGLVPFMDSEVYGRSPLEAASFIVSSAFPDKKMHGQGMLARLSGSTAEFLSMWAIMMGGDKPFSLNPTTGALQLTLSPVIPGWLFPEDGVVSFTFLGSIKVSYVNPSRIDTWKTSAVSVVVVDKLGGTHTTEGGVLGEEAALQVRSLAVDSITVSYA